jgi:RNA polymerase sigma-70 factor (family 1)
MDNPKCITEKRLVENLIKGDFVAFDQLFGLYNKRLYAFALSIIKNKEDARDIVQEVFLRIWRNRYALAQDSSFQSLLFTISYHLIVDKMRKKMSEEQFKDQLLRKAIDKGSPVEEEVEFNELNVLYNEVIEELPSSRKQIYKLHRFEHLNYEEIAQRMNISVNTVRSQMNKALAYIRKRISTQTFAAMLFIALYG